MKLSSILITELFDQPLPIQWSERSEDTWAGKFSVGNRIYDIRMLKDEGMPWEVIFSLVEGNRNTQSITGTGKAATVFATVLNGIQQWLKAVEPEEFAISAAEPSRQKLYKRMLGMLPRKWDIEDLGTTFYARDTTKQEMAHAGYSDDAFSDYHDDY
jgi:hypothetical protein